MAITTELAMLRFSHSKRVRTAPTPALSGSGAGALSIRCRYAATKTFYQAISVDIEFR